MKKFFDKARYTLSREVLLKRWGLADRLYALAYKVDPVSTPRAGRENEVLLTKDDADIWMAWSTNDAARRANLR